MSISCMNLTGLVHHGICGATTADGTDRTSIRSGSKIGGWSPEQGQIRFQGCDIVAFNEKISALRIEHHGPAKQLPLNSARQ